MRLRGFSGFLVTTREFAGSVPVVFREEFDPVSQGCRGRLLGSDSAKPRLRKIGKDMERPRKWCEMQVIRWVAAASKCSNSV